MGDNYVTIKVKKDTLVLLEKAKIVFLNHHKHLEGITLTRNLIVKRALEYYIKS